jgi:KUP system potassium uptake protein
MTRQAIQLGWLPRLIIKQTSAEGYGQIYVGAVNWLLMIVTLGLTIGFGKSNNLAAAYGIAVSLTMLMTSALLFIAMREIWGWSLLAAGAVAGLFMIVDGGFFIANMAKVLQGGYIPLLLASAVYSVMWIWHRGATAVHNQVVAEQTPTEVFVAELKLGRIARVPGSAVFLARATEDTPSVLSWHVRKNRSLHEYVLALTLTVVSTPRVEPEGRVTVTREADKYWRAEARYGFMELPDIPAVIAECKAKGAEIDLADVTYYVGHETIVPREDGQGLPVWQEALYAVMGRNAARISDYLKLPCDNVVEIGREIEI